jgi:hypothetical protein
MEQLAKFPLNYSPERSVLVLQDTEKYLDGNPDIASELHDLLWVYESIQWMVPQTKENYWSGHFFPIVESFQDAQIAYSLCAFGLYKQAMVSLRSALELGLLNVYWNIGDDGHTTIQEWLRAKEETPRFRDVWKKLEGHPNIEAFHKEHDLQFRLLNLNYLHNYVHTAGRRYSNFLGLNKSNFQTFEVQGIKIWLEAMKEVTALICLFHVLKYPFALVRYDFQAKFGVDIPMFGGLQHHQIDRIEQLLGSSYMKTIREIQSRDTTVKEMLDWLESLPNQTDEDREQQSFNIDKMMIEGMGLDAWLEGQRIMYGEYWDKEEIQSRVQKRIDWAKKNGHENPKTKSSGKVSGEASES